jgi:putative DNA primase/helicase
MSAIPLRERANGRWKSILPALGIDSKYLTGRNTACPMCGGRDRWRFDNKRGDGTWICSHCGAGQGIKLSLMFTGQPFREIASKIEHLIGEAPRETVRQEQSDASKRAALNALWQDGKSIRAGDPVDLWMHHRGIGLSIYPGCLRTCSSTRYSGPPTSFHPAMLAKVTDATGRPVTIHRTYLTKNGAKANVDKPRMFCPGHIPPGSAVRLAPPGPTLGIAEGIETAFAASKLHHIPVWAALNTTILAQWLPPEGTERVIVFGDNDHGYAGQAAAYALAFRLLTKNLEVEVRIPGHLTSGDDWNDVALRRGSG